MISDRIDELCDAVFSDHAVETYHRAIQHFGEYHQIAKTKEEAGELLAALKQYISTYFRNIHANKEAVIDELADILITGLQASMILGIDEVIERIDYKIDRLNDLIDDLEKSQQTIVI